MSVEAGTRTKPIQFKHVPPVKAPRARALAWVR